LSERKSTTITTLQAGRALAAIAVLLHHATASTAVFAKGMPPIVSWLGGFGYLGVDFFFVLSGFIIYHVHQQDDRSNLTRYFSNRARRVFIPYWPVGVGMAVVYTLLPNLSAGERQWSWLASLTLLPSVGDPALIVSWTLIYELVFYVIFGAGILLRCPIIVILAWSIIAVTFNFINGAPSANLTPFFSLMTMEFLFGILAASIVPRTSSTKAPLLGAALSFTAYCFAGANPDARTIFGLAMAFIVIAAVRAEGASKIKVPSALVYFGGASYSLYLVHNPVCAFVARLSNLWWVALMAACIAAVAAGIVYHLFVERPMLSLTARIIRKETGDLAS
jgi:peptidoglycan/LPS O-acetylase OafA/YrhL